MTFSVIIVPDEDVYYAQGVEVDYGAQGDTAAEAIENFVAGLSATFRLHRERYGHVTNVVRPTPAYLLSEFRNTPGMQSSIAVVD